jgi:hypothetical protein
MDLFVVPTIGFKQLYGFVIVRIDRRDPLDQRHSQPDGGVDRTPDHRGLSLGRCSGLHWFRWRRRDYLSPAQERRDRGLNEIKSGYRDRLRGGLFCCLPLRIEPSRRARVRHLAQRHAFCRLSSQSAENLKVR